MSLAALNAELAADPLERGYPGMTDQQVIDSLEVRDRARNRTLIASHEIVSAIVPAEWGSLSAGEQDRIKFIVSAGDVNVESPNVRNAFTTAFGAGTQTRENLIALVTETISRREELGLPVFHLADIAAARRL